MVLLVSWIVFCLCMEFREANRYSAPDWTVIGAGFGSVGGALLLFLLSAFTIPATTGLCEDYSQGELVGHVTEVAREGVIWKTNEVWIGLAAESGLVYREPLKVSVPDPVLWGALTQKMGQRVHLRYKGWLIMPFRFGATNYEIVGME